MELRAGSQEVRLEAKKMGQESGERRLTGLRNQKCPPCTKGTRNGRAKEKKKRGTTGKVSKDPNVLEKGAKAWAQATYFGKRRG